MNHPLLSIFEYKKMQREFLPTAIGILLISSLYSTFDFLDEVNRHDAKCLFEISIIALLGIYSLLLKEVKNITYTTLRTILLT